MHSFAMEAGAKSDFVLVIHPKCRGVIDLSVVAAEISFWRGAVIQSVITEVSSMG